MENLKKAMLNICSVIQSVCWDDMREGDKEMMRETKDLLDKVDTSSNNSNNGSSGGGPKGGKADSSEQVELCERFYDYFDDKKRRKDCDLDEWTCSFIDSTQVGFEKYSTLTMGQFRIIEKIFNELNGDTQSQIKTPF